MKKVVYSLLTVLILFACNERKSKIEVIEDFDNIYLSEDRVDRHAQPNNKNDENLVEELKNILKDLHGDTNKKMFYPISYKVYINKEGEIEKIMDDNQYMIGYIMASRIEGNKDLTENNIFKDVDKITNKMLPFLERFKFSPAELDGKAVPFRTKIQTYGIVDENGETTFEISFLNGYSFGPDEVQKNEEYFVAADEMPYPIGGIKAIQEKIVYPETAKKEGIEGRVYIKAFINENGDVVSAEVIKGIGAGCDQEAINAVKSTKFKPARQRGEAVKVQVSIPILFKLN